MRSLLLASLALIAALAPAAQAAPSIAEAQAHYMGNRVAQAESAFAEIADDPAASPRDRSASERALARIAWLIDDRADLARPHVARALATGTDLCLTRSLAVRIDPPSGPQALLAAAELAAACDDPQRADSYRVALLDLVLERMRSDPADAWVAAYGQVLAQVVPEGAQSQPALHHRLAYAVLDGDAVAALTAWRGYFWLEGRDMPPVFADRFDSEVFPQGLGPSASLAGRLRLVDLLIRSGFGHAAEAFATQQALAERAGDDPSWISAQTYFALRRDLTAAELAANRRMARGQDATDFIAAVRSLGQQASGETEPGPMLAALGERWGLYGSVGTTSGYPSLHLGHIVQDDRREVRGFGDAAPIRYIALEGMIANGFETWLWDGAAAAGGWASGGDTIIQIRPGYADGVPAAWTISRPSPAREEALANIARLEAQDTSGDPAAPHPSVPARLRLQGIDAVATAHPDRRGFLAAYWDAILGYSIFLHEGRHVLDQRLDPAPPADQFEYRAKLTELGYSPHVRLPLATILSGVTGADNPHAVGNRRVQEALTAWIEANPDEVAGYDPARPAVLQIDKLSDEQIRAVARALDPQGPDGRITVTAD
ncbi:hypothetical protein Q0812_00100 [Brevundimonas sp. 2R-24]|uniref:Uncharacterized protein n=1 Tax=Peiella sedimenti TaxID=3061083 RepID=A0ABT8SH97_9CAUL|nr:hypothetical protein [Caulobacteraceae bacterium XZ-24]